MSERTVAKAFCAAAIVYVLFLASPALAQETESAGGNSQELAKKLANPVSDLVSIPFQYNWQFGIGPNQGMRTVLNIQPVVPIGITPKWNLIER
jgi:hypothetical protein